MQQASLRTKERVAHGVQRNHEVTCELCKSRAGQRICHGVNMNLGVVVVNGHSPNHRVGDDQSHDLLGSVGRISRAPHQWSRKENVFSCPSRN